MGIPFKYLGLEVGGNPRKKQFWEPIINKIKARLSVWKGRFLTMAGRIWPHQLFYNCYTLVLPLPVQSIGPSL